MLISSPVFRYSKVLMLFHYLPGPTTVQDLASVNQNNSNVERSNQLGLIVGIVCGVLLAVTLISVAIFWTVCWRQQKERLARKIQLHVMYQQRLQQQVGKLRKRLVKNLFSFIISSTNYCYANEDGGVCCYNSNAFIFLSERRRFPTFRTSVQSHARSRCSISD